MKSPLTTIRLGVLLAIGSTAALAAEPPLRITGPADSDTASPAAFIQGVADPDVFKVWVVVRPIDSDDCWIQGPAIVHRDHGWRLKAQFGEAGSPYQGKRYEIRALARPRNAPEPGLSLCGVEAGVVSRAVYVTGK